MFSYRYMNMADLKHGNNDVGFDNALSDYMVIPTEMPMNMCILGAVYTSSNNLTIIIMANHLDMTMGHVTRRGALTTEVSGTGDVSVSGLFRFFNKNKSAMHIQVSISIPTGGVSKKDVIPVSTPNEVILPYPRQLGSGTFDTNLALTYLCQGERHSYGAQLRGILRFGKND